MGRTVVRRDPDLVFRAYLDRVVPPDRASVAGALLGFWDRPWSSNAKRFAYHALRYAFARGLDPLDACG